ncbi:MAG TPA: inositol monophosphatase [Candidatus Magasanikbacteria bacterium]|nr:inositol monophosphatase [Candidatus Magasanikbacteria bacterium]
MTNNTLLKILQTLSEEVTIKIKKTRHLGSYTKTTGAGGDQTKNGDAVVEKIITKKLPQLLKKYNLTDCLVISEETGIKKFGQTNQGIFLIIDPIDGSNNMRPHFTPAPFLGFSIAAGYLKDFYHTGNWQAIQVSLIKNIFYPETFHAIRGKGSYLNNQKIKSSSLYNLAEATLGTSLDKTGERLKTILNSGAYDLLLKTKCQRRLGSTTLDLCRVATGDYDLYLSLSGGVKLHDLAAAKLIIEEAGGIVKIYNKDNPTFLTTPFKELLKQGNQGIQNINFKILASGNKLLLKKAEKILPTSLTI